ncbi:YbfB/YjiJ family MFS transporter [Bartonella grahamii]|uniref:YbfB/YjiJ family MFS transporter n=1 Tax=Bartonella grahamii TaxID=33045 RepID=UPI002360C433|nr:YbfB/YjiJ family MFS transporter [Bartonella grahamii]
MVLLIRFASGVASVAMMVLGSIMVMQHSHNRRIIASLYAGVGVGILLGNEYVIISLNRTLDATNIWFEVGLMFVQNF